MGDGVLLAPNLKIRSTITEEAETKECRRRQTQTEVDRV